MIGRNLERNRTALGAGVSDFDEAAIFELVVGKPVRSRIELVAVRVGNGGDHLFVPRFAVVEAVVVLITNGRGQELERQCGNADNGEDQESGGHAARSLVGVQGSMLSSIVICSSDKSASTGCFQPNSRNIRIAKGRDGERSPRTISEAYAWLMPSRACISV